MQSITQMPVVQTPDRAGLYSIQQVNSQTHRKQSFTIITEVYE